METKNSARIGHSWALFEANPLIPFKTTRFRVKEASNADFTLRIFVSRWFCVDPFGQLAGNPARIGRLWAVEPW